MLQQSQPKEGAEEQETISLSKMLCALIAQRDFKPKHNVRVVMKLHGGGVLATTTDEV